MLRSKTAVFFIFRPSYPQGWRLETCPDGTHDPVNERYRDFSPTTYQRNLDIVVVYDMNDFSKGGEVRCPVAECSGFYSLDFDLKTS